MRECFVIMPIGSGDAHQVYCNRYTHIIQPAVEGLNVDGQQVFRCVRADFVTKTGSITRDLLGRLYHSDAVIADLTDLNPNVFYELGVRHALRGGTILIALKGTKPPFDVGDLRVIPYEDRLGGEKDAIPRIQEMLISLLSEERPQDSPVLHAIPELAGIAREELHEKNKELEILRMENKEIREKISAIESVFQMVRMIIGEHALNINNYVSYTCLFLAQKKLESEFREYLPEEARKTGKEHG